MEIFLEDPDSKWNEGIMLQEYHGVFSLVSANKSTNSEGTVWMRWGFPQNKDKKPIDKAIPWKIRLGSKRQAVKTLQYFLEQLTNSESEDGTQPF